MAHLEWKQKPLGLVQWLRFDAVRAVELGQASTVTKHPIQKGADVADHVRVAMPRVSITGYVGIAPLTVDSAVERPKDIPIANGLYQLVPLPPPPVGIRPSILQGGLLDAATSALSKLSGPGSVESLITFNPNDRPAIAATRLLELQEKVERLRFVDELQTYEDMVITSVVGTRVAQFYGAVFQIEVEKISIVESKLVDLPLPAEPRGQKGKSTASAPKSSGQSPVDDAKRQSMLNWALGKFGI